MNIGLIVNPIAGMGGKVGLKGTDGENILKRAIEAGAVKESPYKTKKMLNILREYKNKINIMTVSGDMGETECLEAGIDPEVVFITEENTSSKDTEEAAKEMIKRKVSVIVFAGGDGTARNIYNAVGDKIPVIGIPTGVKIHSAVFATKPENAGRAVINYLENNSSIVKEREVMDIDEEALRNERVSAKLYGYMRVPFDRQYIQALKSGGNNTDKAIISRISRFIVGNMEEDTYYIIGAGTTTKAILERLNLQYTLLGSDIVYNGKIILKDANEKDLLKITTNKKAKIIVSPIGGQGFIFGRGNQQISAEVITNVGVDNIIIIANSSKLLSLSEKCLRVDTGRDDINDLLKRSYKIIVDYGEYYVMSCK